LSRKVEKVEKGRERERREGGHTLEALKMSTANSLMVPKNTLE
jgi:hypothetical protein